MEFNNYRFYLFNFLSTITWYEEIMVFVKNGYYCFFQTEGFMIWIFANNIHNVPSVVAISFFKITKNPTKNLTLSECRSYDHNILLTNLLNIFLLKGFVSILSWISPHIIFLNSELVPSRTLSTYVCQYRYHFHSRLYCTVPYGTNFGFDVVIFFLIITI